MRTRTTDPYLEAELAADRRDRAEAVRQAKWDAFVASKRDEWESISRQMAEAHAFLADKEAQLSFVP